MIIKEKNKKYEFIDLFSFDDFKIYVEKNKIISNENDLRLIYQNINSLKNTILLKDFKKVLNRIDFYNQEENEKYLFFYRKNKFEINYKPYCNLCNNKLLIINNKNISYSIIGCENNNCDTNLKDQNIFKYKAFLPNDLYLKNLEDTKKRKIVCKEYWIAKGFSEDDAINKIKELQKNTWSKKIVFGTTLSKKTLKEKGFSEDEISYFFKKRSILCKEYWISRGYSENDTDLKIKEIYLERGEQLKEFRISNPELISYTTQLSYWIAKGFSEKEAKLKLKERQTTFSLKICIEKYGEIEGLEKWNSRQQKWLKSLYDGNYNFKIGYSIISQKLFDILLENYNPLDIEKILYATNNKEYFIFDEGNYFFYDFTDLKNKKIIEFNGDIYHANPLFYTENDKPHPFIKHLTAKQMWEKDNNKINVANKMGFDVLTIWEHDFKIKKEEIINKCLDFLNK